MRKIIFTLFLLKLCASTLNGQDYWELINSPEALDIYDIAVDSEGRIYLACPSPYETLTGIYRSDDSGLTWQLKIFGMDTSYNVYPHPRSISIDNLDNLIIGETSRIYRSANHGEEWTEVFSALPYGYAFLYAQFGLDSIFLIGGESNCGIVRSGDNGNSWQVTLDFTDFEPDYPEAVTGICFGPDNVIYVCTETYVGGYGSVYKSDDYGLTWSVFFNTGDAVFNSIAFDHSARLLVGSFGFYRYDFSSGLWEFFNYNIMPKEILIAPVDKIFMACPWGSGGVGGVAYSDNNGETISMLNEGMTYPNATDFAIDLSGRILVSGNNSSLYRSYDSLLTKVDNYSSLNSEEIILFPNPCGNFLHFKSLNKNIEKIIIYNPQGELVYEGQVSGDNNKKFDLSLLSPGIYLAIIHSFSDKSAIKFIHH